MPFYRGAHTRDGEELIQEEEEGILGVIWIGGEKKGSRDGGSGVRNGYSRVTSVFIMKPPSNVRCCGETTIYIDLICALPLRL